MSFRAQQKPLVLLFLLDMLMMADSASILPSPAGKSAAPSLCLQLSPHHFWLFRHYH